MWEQSPYIQLLDLNKVLALQMFRRPLQDSLRKLPCPPQFVNLLVIRCRIINLHEENLHVVFTEHNWHAAFHRKNRHPCCPFDEYHRLVHFYWSSSLVVHNNPEILIKLLVLRGFLGITIGDMLKIAFLSQTWMVPHLCSESAQSSVFNISSFTSREQHCGSKSSPLMAE